MGSGQHSILQGWERSVFNQTNTGTVVGTTSGRLLRDKTKCVWVFTSAQMSPGAETEKLATEKCKTAVIQNSLRNVGAVIRSTNTEKQCTVY